MIDILFQERGHTPLKEFESDARAIESAWFQYLMPATQAAEKLCFVSGHDLSRAVND